MKIHKIKDLSNTKIVNLLKSGLEHVIDNDLKYNYSPDYLNNNANLFYILNNGRFKDGNYYVIEDNGKYICSAGWNKYDDNTALLLVRAYVLQEYRTQYLLGKILLPFMIEETEKEYNNVWVTCNEYNKSIYNWFYRSSIGKSGALFNNWPEIYKRFEPIGKKIINYTEQYVVALRK